MGDAPRCSQERFGGQGEMVSLGAGEVSAGPEYRRELNGGASREENAKDVLGPALGINGRDPHGNPGFLFQAGLAGLKDLRGPLESVYYFHLCINDTHSRIEVNPVFSSTGWVADGWAKLTW